MLTVKQHLADGIGTMQKVIWEKNIFELIRHSSTDFLADGESEIQRCLRSEVRGSHAARALETILESARIARENDVPVCEDTGSLIFYFSVSIDFDANSLAARTQAAVARATRLGYLRENTIDSVWGVPYHYERRPRIAGNDVSPRRPQDGRHQIDHERRCVGKRKAFNLRCLTPGAKPIVIRKACAVAFWMGYGRLRETAAAPA